MEQKSKQMQRTFVQTWVLKIMKLVKKCNKRKCDIGTMIQTKLNVLCSIISLQTFYIIIHFSNLEFILFEIYSLIFTFKYFECHFLCVSNMFVVELTLILDFSRVDVLIELHEFFSLF